MNKILFLVLIFLWFPLLTNAQNIVIGDVVVLKCIQEPKLDGEYRVSEKGEIVLPIIGGINIQGLTEKQAAERIAKTIIEKGVSQQATVSITLKAREPIRYGGAVRNAGEVAYREGISLKDVITRAEPTVVADLTAIRIVRPGGEVRTVDYTLFEKGNPEGNPLLYPGEEVFVPLKVAGLEVLVLGAVNRPGILIFTEGLTVEEAIRKAGGLRRDGDPKAIELARNDGTKKKINMDSEEAELLLQPGDQITVGMREITDYIYVRGAVTRPGLVPFTEGLTLLEALAESQPFENARLDRVKLYRKQEGGGTKMYTMNVREIQANSSEDMQLQPEDIIEVPYPSKSYSAQNTVQVLGFLLLLYFLFKR
ncbi:MAG TPA: SLBB domain-containing protein [Fimbriimonadales bacterium]|nr:SLBB domain-containing protein [Fimbriimonadales bacterium]